MHAERLGIAGSRRPRRHVDETPVHWRVGCAGASSHPERRDECRLIARRDAQRIDDRGKPSSRAS